jgi:hypothetical protein
VIRERVRPLLERVGLAELHAHHPAQISPAADSLSLPYPRTATPPKTPETRVVR